MLKGSQMMKSISELSTSLIESVQKAKTKTSLSLLLPSRPTPLVADDIEKIDRALCKCFKIEKRDKYGYVAIKDAKGNFVKNEFDVVGQEDVFSQIAEMPAQLKEAILRPAEKRHIIFHLTRLAAHRRDTRGAEAFQVFLEDASNDMKGVSEWAVISACKEFRTKGELWYPTTAEIMKTITKNQETIESFCTVKADQEAITDQSEKQKPEEWTQPTDDEKAKVSEMVQAAINKMGEV